ncbi:hypothetical protein AVEN_183730-1 [Araneus ventricosus]|uniref:Uncharacterized protein n=1 Tax=Araneus ventricosus TaxID=182803 RepID=A0A4Y2IZ07_ARAVE|nr:hypothetical protein AVEN_183730-1 [Araneus ventricosus]
MKSSPGTITTNLLKKGIPCEKFMSGRVLGSCWQGCSGAGMHWNTVPALLFLREVNNKKIVKMSIKQHDFCHPGWSIPLLERPGTAYFVTPLRLLVTSCHAVNYVFDAEFTEGGHYSCGYSLV